MAAGGGAVDLVLELLEVIGVSVVVRLVCRRVARELGSSERELRLGELGVRSSMLKRRRCLVVVGGAVRGAKHRLRLASPPLLGAFAVPSHGAVLRLAGLAVRGMTLAPAAVLPELKSLRVVPLALIRLIVPALALFTGESGGDPDVSSGHLRSASHHVGGQVSGSGPRA
jgi:hypothetical protein